MSEDNLEQPAFNDHFFEPLPSLYETLRGTEILQTWTIDKQLEAFTDHFSGDSTKLNELLTFIETIKDKYPKNNPQ